MPSNRKQTLQNQYLSLGFDTMSRRQKLEWLLTFSMKSEDASGLAGSLIERFGSIGRAIRAESCDLMRMEGMSKNSAVFFKLISRIADLYSLSEYDNVKMDSIETLANYLILSYSRETNEVSKLILLDGNMFVKSSQILEEGNESSVRIDRKLILQRALAAGCKRCVIAHNHPNYISKPSNADIEVTKKTHSYLKKYGIDLIDHIVIGEDGYTAMIDSGICKVEK